MKKFLIVVICLGIVFLLVDLSQIALSAAAKPKTPSDKDRIVLLEGRIAILEAQETEIAEEHLARLYARTEDLNERLSVFEAHMNDLKAKNWSAQGQMNGLDARVTELERPEVEDDAK